MDRVATFTMTRERTWTLTAISVVLFVLLSWVFADGLLAPPLWNSEDWVSSPLITYLIIVLILAVGWIQAQQISTDGLPLRLVRASLTPGQVEDPVGWRLLMGTSSSLSSGCQFASSWAGTGSPLACTR